MRGCAIGLLFLFSVSPALCGEAVEYFLAPPNVDCAACRKFVGELRRGAFRNLRCEWREGDAQKSGVNTFPAFRVPGYPIFSINPYDGQTVYDTLKAQLSSVPPSGARTFDSTGETTYAEQAAELAGEKKEPGVVVVAPSGDPESGLYEPIGPVESSEIELSDVRVVVLSARSIPGGRLMRGPLDRLIARVMGGKVSVDVITQAEHPGRYAAVCESAGVDSEHHPLHVLLMVGKIAQAGFVKSQIIKKIESEIREKLETADLSFTVDAVFERLHREHWNQVNSALAVHDAGDDDTAGGVVAFVLSLLAFMKANRAGRGVWSRVRKNLLPEDED